MGPPLAQIIEPARSSPLRFRGSARLRLGGEDREAVHDLDQSLTIDAAQPLVFLQKGQALLKMQVKGH